jgi:hypothetical protein
MHWFSSETYEIVHALVALVSLIVAIITALAFLSVVFWFRRRVPELLRILVVQIKGYNPYRNMALQDNVNVQIDILEREFSIRLTPDARRLLISPIVDYFVHPDRRITERDYERVWTSSIVDIMRTIYEYRFEAEPERYEYIDDQRILIMSSISVLNALRIRWCNIPPFCKQV